MNAKASASRFAEQLFAASARGEKSLLPYVTAGFPNLECTAALVERFAAAGCRAIEIGIPFSDSIADGPVIQESFHQALRQGFRIDDLFRTIESVRPRVAAGLLAMVSMSLVRRSGVEAFVRRAAGSGFDGLIVPDVPLEECAELARVADEFKLCNVLMIAPTTPAARRAAILGATSGFVYLIAARGITGQREQLASGLAEQVAQVRSESRLPVMVGFGIQRPDQVREVCKSADGVIVGSAIVSRIAESAANGASPSALVERIGGYVDELVGALK